ncbi:PEGA domain-containing protein [Lichenicola cladoniae]|uniref:PEGA domain-containing protein n=1 Tax=Lichenicola cladoniae TaxID=1484109 RepID=A0A6M8HQV8_9PROT|nr:PEGA domain-containing protein [Lichenicola cladoniae]NPD68030.1 PEGA domain-containing protein [Acetobacteraceae bacterium]QKE90611.1 PEGA domain-containing protein [Lichenicola cladoniae]
MAGHHPCAACGETLQGVVSFCPFCGASQQPAPARIPAASVVPSPAPPTPPRELPAVPIHQPVPHRLVPIVVPAPRVAPPVPPAAQPAPLPKQPPTPAQRRSRRDALRKLLLAAIILICGAILWQHLTTGPHATLRVHLSRQAEGALTIDGARAGTTDEAIRLAPGRHVVGFDADAWTTIPVTIRLRDGETRTIELVPIPHRALLSLDSVPGGARIVVGERRLGRAPATISLPPGPVRVTAALAGYEPVAQTIVLAPGEHRSLALTLQAIPAQTLHLVAPAGIWSEPVTLAQGDRFILLFHGRIRVRANGRVLLLDGFNRTDLGTFEDRTLAFTAVDGAPVDVDLIIHKAGSPG